MEFYVISAIKAAVLAAVLMTTLAYLQWVERKVIVVINRSDQGTVDECRNGKRGFSATDQGRLCGAAGVF